MKYCRDMFVGNESKLSQHEMKISASKCMEIKGLKINAVWKAREILHNIFAICVIKFTVKIHIIK